MDQKSDIHFLKIQIVYTAQISMQFHFISLLLTVLYAHSTNIPLYKEHITAKNFIIFFIVL